MTHDTVTLRPVRDEDDAFLLALYSSTRAGELAQVDWTPEQKQAFCEHQFRAQTAHWRAHYTDTSYDVVEMNGEPVGRLYVARWPREIRIVDVAIVPEHRGRGLGRRLIEAIFADADAAGKPVSIHVEVYNPARRLYDRLGFVLKEDKGIYHLMERHPAGVAAGA